MHINNTMTNTDASATPIAAASSVPNAAPKLICLRPRNPGPHLPAISAGATLLANERLTVPDELIHGLLHQGTKGVLAGGSKVGKTNLALDLSTSVATGTRFLRWDTIPARVLFVNLEIYEAFFKQRLQAMMEQKGLSAIENLDIWTLRGHSVDSDTLLESIIERAQGKDYALIILDPIYKLMVGRSENTASGVGSLCQKIEQLMVRTGAAVVYAHHFSKGNQAAKKAMDRLSGSGVFARDADTLLMLTEHSVEGCYTVEMVLRNLPPQPPFVVEWTFPVMVERPDLDPDDLKKDEKTQDESEFLLELLDEKPLTTTEWQKRAQEEGVARATFYRAKSRLEQTNKITANPNDKTWIRTVEAVSVSTDTCETATCCQSEG